MTNACRACHKSITCNGLTCVDCAQSFHGKCVFNASDDAAENRKKWKCGKCLKKPGVHAQAPNVRVQAPVVHVQAPNHVQVPVVHVQAPVAQGQAPNVRVQAPNIHVPAPVVHVQAPNAGVQVPVVHVQAPVAQGQAPNVRVQAPNIHVPAPVTHAQAPNAGVHAPVAHVQASNVRAQVANVRLPATLVHAQAPNARIRVPVGHVQASKTKKVVRTSPNVNDVYSMFLDLKKDLKTFQTGLLDSIKRLHAKIESNTERFDEQNKKLSECFEIIRGLKKENEDLRNDIGSIKKRQAEADQKTRQNDLEIRGIPPQPNENVVGILQSLALALRSPLMIDGHCIVFCYRARPKDDGSPGTIHVRFSHHIYKDDILRRRCAYRGFNSRLMSLPVTSHLSVFVNESLCPERRVLFKMANELRREKKYKYIWTREGRILLRKSDYCQVISINCLADLNKL